MGENILPYAELAEKPESQAWINWVDLDTNTSNSVQTFKYRKKGSQENYLEVSSERVSVPSQNGVYKHTVFLESLKSNTVYECEIDTGEDTLSVEIKTLPRRLWKQELKILVISDIHMERPTSSLFDPTEWNAMRNENPEVMLFGGDYQTRGDLSASRTEEEIISKWIEFWDNHMKQNFYDENLRLIPIFSVPGNHDTGNHGWNGTGSVTPEVAYFQYWFKGMTESSVVGQNYGSRKVAGCVQFIGFDTQSAFFDVQRDWVNNNNIIRDDVHACIVFLHNPFFPNGTRSSSDLQGSQLLRETILTSFYGKKSVQTIFNGHIHTEKRTKRLKFVTEEPSSGDYEDIGSGLYVVEGTEEDYDFIEMGEGYPNNRSSQSRWWNDFAQGGDNSIQNFAIITLSQDKYEVEEIRPDSTRRDTSVFNSLVVPRAKKGFMVGGI